MVSLEFCRLFLCLFVCCFAMLVCLLYLCHWRLNNDRTIYIMRWYGNHNLMVFAFSLSFFHKKMSKRKKQTNKKLSRGWRPWFLFVPRWFLLVFVYSTHSLFFINIICLNNTHELLLLWIKRTKQNNTHNITTQQTNIKWIVSWNQARWLRIEWKRSKE